MKKILLSAVALVAAMNMNAQTESAFMDADALGLSSEAKSMTAGTLLCSSANIEMRVAYDCDYKKVALCGNDDFANTINIAGVDYSMSGVAGAQGQTNPTENSVGTLTEGVYVGGQTAGAVFQFNVKADGYLYVFSKLSGNKQYYAWEGPANAGQGTFVAYKQRGVLNAQKNNQGTLGTLVNIDLPGNADGYYDGSLYLNDAGTQIKKIAEIVNDLDNVPNVDVAIMGVTAFPVYKDAETYFYNACGSKVTCNGFVFIPGATDIAAVSFSKGGETGISTVKAAKNVEGVAYNLAGQKVNNSFKGIVIKNGVKMIQK